MNTALTFPLSTGLAPCALFTEDRQEPRFKAIGAPDPLSLLQAQVDVFGACILVYLVQVSETGAGWQTFHDSSTFDDEAYHHLLELLGDDNVFETIHRGGREYILLAVPAQRD